MRTKSLEKFYSKIEKRVKVLAAYTENSFIERIIHLARLKPLSLYIAGFKPEKPVLDNVWVDEFDHRIFLKDRELIVKSGFTPLNKPGTDIYRSQTFDFIFDASELALVGLNKNSVLFIFWRSDNFFHAFKNDGNGWKVVSPLSAGLKILEHFWSEKGLPVEKLNDKCCKMKWFRLRLPVEIEEIEDEELRSLFDEYEGEY